jgi:hypothetical protein
MEYFSRQRRFQADEIDVEAACRLGRERFERLQALADRMPITA